MPKILIACASTYNGFELGNLISACKQYNVQAEITSYTSPIKEEKSGKYNKVTKLFNNCIADDYSGLAIVSGPLEFAKKLWKDPDLRKLIFEMDNADKVLGSICIAAPTLVPVLRGLSISHYPTYECAEYCRLHGVKTSGKIITIEGKKVTAENEMASGTWADIFISLVLGNCPKVEYVASNFDGARRRRKVTSF